MARFRKQSNLILTVVLVAVIALGIFGFVSLFKKVDNLEPTKTVSASVYERGLLDDTTGKLPRNSEDIDYSGIHMKEYVKADGLTCEILEEGKIKYEINFFDEDYTFISVLKKTSNYDGTEKPADAKFAIVEIVALADVDGIVSSSEVKTYANMLKVVYSK